MSITQEELARYQILKPLADEFDDLKDKLRKAINENDKISKGPLKLRWSWTEVTNVAWAKIAEEFLGKKKCDEIREAAPKTKRISFNVE